MESKSKEAGVNDEGVISCENQIDETTETSLDLGPTQKSQADGPDVLKDCRNLSEEEDKDCTLEISNSQVSLNLNNVEAEQACAFQSPLNLKNEDIVEQQEELDSRGRQSGSSCLETSEASDIGCTQIPVPGEKMPFEIDSSGGQLLISTVECIPVFETDFIEIDETQLAKSDLTSEIQGQQLQVTEACEKNVQPSEETFYTIVDYESNCFDEIITENMSELSVGEKQVRTEPMMEDHSVAHVLVGEPDTSLQENSASIGEIMADKTQNIDLGVVEEDAFSKRLTLLEKQVDKSLNLCSKSMEENYSDFKKLFEENYQQKVFLQEMASQAEILKSTLRSTEKLPEELKYGVLDRLEACFKVGHWLEKSVKSKQLAECMQLLNKSYVSLSYNGISKVKSIIEHHSQGTSKSPEQGPQADNQETSCVEFLVTITHVIDPGEFYIVRLCDKGKLEKILLELRDNASSYPIPLEITPGIVYAVCNSGHNWYRGCCGKMCGHHYVGDQPAEILYEFFMIDQGHHEQVPASSIRILPQELLNYSSIARECTLNHNFQGAPWSNQDTTLFKQMTRQSPMNMKILSQHGGVLEVDLAQLVSFGEAANIVSVRDALFLAHRSSSTEPPKKKFKQKFAIEELNRSKHFSVIVSAAESPSKIYFQVLDEQYNAYCQMNQELQNEMDNASTPSSFSQIQKGYICAVKYDGLWFRCLVEEIYQRNRLLVFYVDSGQRQSVNCSNCFNLPERFLDLPAQAMRCKLDGVTHMNPRVPIMTRHRRNQNQWSREAVNMVRDYCNARGHIFIENWNNGEIGRLDRELTAFVTLYRDGEPASLNAILCRNNYAISCKQLAHPEHGVIRANLTAQRRIFQSTSVNSVGSGLDASSTDVSVISLAPLENCIFSQPSNCLISDPISVNSVLTETDQATKELNKDQHIISNVESESVPSASVLSLSIGKSFVEESFGNPLAALDLNELLSSVNSAHDAQESIACGLSSPMQRPVSSFEGNTFLVNEAADNAFGYNIETPNFIPNPWTNCDFKFGNLLTSESVNTDSSSTTLKNKTPLEDFNYVSNPGNEHSPQESLTDLTSRMSLKSSLVQPNILTTASNERRTRKFVNKTVGSSDGTSIAKFNADSEIVGTQGSQPDSETSITVSLVWIDSPEAIFFRTADMQSQYEKLRYQMMEHYRKFSKRPKKNFDIGFRCAVKDGGSWWRAEVVCMDDFPKCNVSFVDTGYQRTVNWTQIFPLESQFDEIKRLMLKCSLVGVYPVSSSDGQWNEETVNYIRDQLLGSEKIYILRRGPESTCSALPVMCMYVYDVEAGPLQIPGMTRINLNEELVSKGLAHHCSEPLLLPKHITKIQTWKTTEPKFGSVFWGIVTWINAAGEIYLHDVKSKPALEEMEKWLNAAYNGTEPSYADLRCRPGDLCIARYKVDKTWSRAIVKSTDEEPGSVTVFFVDYGTKDLVDSRDIRLNIMLEESPTVPICCKLYNIRPFGGQPKWPTETLDIIHKDIVGKEFRVHVKVSSHPLQIVLLNKKNISYSDELVNRSYAEFIDPSLRNKKKKKKQGKKPKSDLGKM